MGVMNDRVKNIVEMEERLDKIQAAVDEAQAAIDKLKSLSDEMELLRNYYIDGEWTDDFDAHNEGKIAQDIKCGVLSEDAVYNLLTDNYSLAIDMLETATEMIKNH